MTIGLGITYGRLANYGPSATQELEPRLPEFTTTHHQVSDLLRDTYGETIARRSTILLTYFDYILEHAGNGMTDEAMADHIYRTEFRCGRGQI